jgi:magnesium transporter
VLEVYGERIEAMEAEILNNPPPDTIGRVHEIKHDLLTLRRAIWPAREAFNALVRDPTPLIHDETRLYLRDCYDHCVQLIDLLETYRELGSDLRDLYLSCMSTRMNEIMKVLTIIATIFIPLTFIVGIYGMNFTNMPELHSKWGYPMVWAVMGLITLGMIAFFRRKGWIGRK